MAASAGQRRGALVQSADLAHGATGGSLRATTPLGADALGLAGGASARLKRRIPRARSHRGRMMIRRAGLLSAVLPERLSALIQQFNHLHDCDCSAFWQRHPRPSQQIMHNFAVFPRISRNGEMLRTRLHDALAVRRQASRDDLGAVPRP